jgi:hypothetical protein
MPTLFRFLTIVGVLGASLYGGSYFLATVYEPEPQETSKVLPGVKIRK